MAITNHVGPSGVLVHGIDNERNGNRQEHDSVQLTHRVTIVRKRHDSNRSTSQNYGKMHPRQKGTLVGEKHLGFNLDGGLTHFHERSYFTVRSLLLFGTKQVAKEATAIASSAWLRDLPSLPNGRMFLKT
jgi:hypothetical protein